jgi:hypothetical protein
MSGSGSCSIYSQQHPIETVPFTPLYQMVDSRVSHAPIFRLTSWHPDAAKPPIAVPPAKQVVAQLLLTLSQAAEHVANVGGAVGVSRQRRVAVGPPSDEPPLEPSDEPPLEPPDEPPLDPPDEPPLDPPDEPLFDPPDDPPLDPPDEPPLEPLDASPVGCTEVAQ